MKVRVGEVEIGYDRAGSGEPVLLVMGLGTSRVGWFNQFAFLKERYDVTAFDNRGSGESACASAQWTMADLVADAFGVADAMGYESFHLAGVSMGGMISQEMALAAPDRVLSLSLVSTSPGGPVGITVSPEYLEAFGLPDPKERVRRSIELLFGSRYRREHPEIVEAAVTFALGGGTATSASFFDSEADSSGFVGQMSAVMNWAMAGGTAERLSAITAPTLVLHGGEDLLIGVGSSKVLADGIAGSRLRVWDDAGHALIQEYADEVNAELVAHFERATARR